MKGIKLHLATFLIATTASVSLFPLVVSAGKIFLDIEGNREVVLEDTFVDLGSVNLSNVDQIIEGITFANGIEVNDFGDPVMPAGWSLVMSVEDFVSDTYNEITYDNLQVQPDDDGVLHIIGGYPEVTGVTTFSDWMAFSGTGEVSDAITLITADNRERASTYRIIPELKLTVPAYTAKDTYNSTFTFTFVIN
jgi:hypothetical protein